MAETTTPPAPIILIIIGDIGSLLRDVGAPVPFTKGSFIGKRTLNYEANELHLGDTCQKYR